MRTLALHPDPDTARRELHALLLDGIHEYETPRNDHGRPMSDASHLAAHLTWYLTLAGESAEEQGEDCPLCEAVREAGEGRS